MNKGKIKHFIGMSTIIIIDLVLWIALIGIAKLLLF